MSRRIYTAAEIARSCGGQLKGDGERSITRLATDSRNLYFSSDALFVALVGKNHNAHRFVQDAWNQGARCFLVQEEVELEDATIIRVDETLKALQDLARAHRDHFYYPVLGITGSNGKTIVKEWLNLMLADHYSIVRSPRSFNSQVGVALSLWLMEEGHELAIVEAGISEREEMARLEDMIKPSHVLLTNIRQAHQENFASRQAMAVEKISLAKGAHTVVYRADYPEWERAMEIAGIKPVRAISWTLGPGMATWTVRRIKGNRYAFRSEQDEFFLDLPDTQSASLENAISAVLMAREFGLEIRDLEQGLQRLSTVPMRLELLKGKRGIRILSDVYSSDLASLEIALETLTTYDEGRKRVAIISQMEQTGWSSDVWMNRLDMIFREYAIDEVFGVGPVFEEEKGGPFSMALKTYVTVDELITSGDLEEVSNAAVLVKGARSFALETVVRALQQRTHNTVLEVDLSAVQHNLDYFRAKLNPGVGIMAMVKASGYGSGSVELAQMLSFNQVDYLAVAYVDEGITLREHGISLPIMVLNPETAALEEMIAHRLEPEVFSMKSLQDVLAVIVPAHHKAAVPIHIKLDTGMRRLGFEPSDIAELCSTLRTHPQVRVASIFSHLSAADDIEANEWSLQQVKRFEDFAHRFETSLGYQPKRHILNTSGILNLPADYQYQMVRLGIGLYGIDPRGGGSSELIPVQTLKTVVSQIKKVSTDEPVGYGRSFQAKKDMTIATLPVGYADGLPRALSNGVGSVWVNGKVAPIVGNICMDMCMVDVSNVTVKEGDSVEIFGKSMPVETFSKAIGTIPYEILSGIPERVRRLYIRE